MKLIKKIIKSALKKVIGDDIYEKQIFLEGVKASLVQKKIKKIKDFSEIEFSVFSQWGDDGIINWLVENLPIKSKLFVEIGTEDYRESNTRFLLMKRNWTGYLVEGNKTYTNDIKKQSIHWKYDLNVVNKFLNKNNVNMIINELNLPGEIGLLSIDIDGNDYWIWEKIDNIKPIIFVCEYNAVLGDIKKLTIPYKKNFLRTKFHYSNLAYGASINAFQKLSERKGYVFIGTNSNGVNAYFLKKRYFKFLKGKIKNFKKFPSKFKESRNKSYEKNFLKGINRKKAIEKVDLIELNKKKKIIKLKNIKRIYTKKWSYN